ncbi:MAG: alpha/beta fold hydrolase, partial [Oscillospiraceae bacterium]
SALYDEFCRFLADHGFVAAIFDNLGHGRSVSAGGDFGYFFQGGLDNVIKDSKKIHDILQENFPNVPYFVMGHSMGSFLVRDYITKYGDELAGAVLMGTSAGLKPHMWAIQKNVLRAAIRQKGPRGKSKTISDMATGPYNKHFPNPRTPNDWVSSDEAEVDKYTNDPMCGFPLTLSGYMDLGLLLNRVNGKEWYLHVPKKLPILVTSGDNDPVGEMGKGVRRIVANLVKTEHDCEMILYPGVRHALLTEVNKNQVFTDILSFLTYKCARMTSAACPAPPISTKS